MIGTIRPLLLVLSLVSVSFAAGAQNGDSSVFSPVLITGSGLVVVLLLFAVMLLLLSCLIIRCRRTSQALCRAKELLLRQDTKSETIVESLPVGVEVYSEDGVLISINNRDCEIFGLTKEEATQGGLSISGNPNLPDQIKEAFANGEKIHANFPYDFIVVQETGFYETSHHETEVKRICCNGTPVLDSNGKMQNYVFIVDDITEQYKQERRLEESIRLSDQAIQAADMVLWKYNNKIHMFSAYNDSVNNYDRNVKLSVESYLLIIHPDDRQQYGNAVELMDLGRNESFEFNVRMKNSNDYKWQYCTISGTPFMKDNEGNIEVYTGFRRNITKWKELNDNLIKVNIQNELILNNSNSGLAFLTPDYIVQWENVSICTASISSTMYRQGELCYKSTYGRTTPCENCVMHRATLTKTTESKCVELNGRSLEVFATPILKPNGEVEGVVIRLDDVTDRQRMISELSEAKENAVKSDKLKSAFLANMSHEIRTPLNAIVGFADLLISTDDPDEKVEYNKIITTNNDLLLRLINDILNLSKIEAGYVDRKPEEFDLSLYFDEICSSIQQRMSNSDVEFIRDNPYRHCIVSLDKSRLAQIILNYATNAIKYTPHGYIRVGYAHQGNGIRLYVTDSGIGISEKKKHLVYERFEKLDEFAQGTGLGLSICKALSDISGGHLGFESEEGIGSTFWSWVPCNAVIYDDTRKQIPDNEGERCVKDLKSVVIDESEKKILIAEDIDSNYMLISAILHKKYCLSRVVNGYEAVERIRSEHFDLILMDMKMPIMGGLEATERIREFNLHIPIIALTAHAFAADKDAAINVGCSDYLVKPINKNLLFDVLTKWI